jgi:hypothetical protein
MLDRVRKTKFARIIAYLLADAVRKKQTNVLADAKDFQWLIRPAKELCGNCYSIKADCCEISTCCGRSTIRVSLSFCKQKPLVFSLNIFLHSLGPALVDRTI